MSRAVPSLPPLHQVLAYQLDHGHFASVPLTLRAEAVHPAFFVASHVALSRYGAKVGSLQRWVRHDDVAANLGASTFPTREVHKIALLDMRLLNCDRNDTNVLVRDLPPRSPGGASTKAAGLGVVRSSNPEASRSRAESESAAPELDQDRKARRCELVPIDHGGCLPSTPAVAWYNWCWLSWPQLSTTPDAETKAYIARLDPAAEVRYYNTTLLQYSTTLLLYYNTSTTSRGYTPLSRQGKFLKSYAVHCSAGPGC